MLLDFHSGDSLSQTSYATLQVALVRRGQLPIYRDVLNIVFKKIYSAKHVFLIQPDPI